MIKLYPYEELGRGDFGWLQARYHFSFARYRNPERMGFGALRVINDDIVKAGAGFEPHPHKDMEIITYVRSGAISHKDSEGHAGKTKAGNVQVMSAGTGITHAEYNEEDVDTTLYQIWIKPREKAVAPRWATKEFPQAPVDGALRLLVSGRAADQDKGALYIHQDAAIYGGILPAGSVLTHNLQGQAYLLVAAGRVEIDGVAAQRGDGMEITGRASIDIKAGEEAEIILIEVPAD